MINDEDLKRYLNFFIEKDFKIKSKTENKDTIHVFYSTGDDNRTLNTINNIKTIEQNVNYINIKKTDIKKFLRKEKINKIIDENN